MFELGGLESFSWHHLKLPITQLGVMSLSHNSVIRQIAPLSIIEIEVFDASGRFIFMPCDNLGRGSEPCRITITICRLSHRQHMQSIEPMKATFISDGKEVLFPFQLSIWGLFGTTQMLVYFRRF
jgi:hypothetical protein